jgi:peptidoglycan/LPS O-acetylase OafA/YrhL
MAIGGLGAYWICYNSSFLFFIRSLKKLYVVAIYFVGLVLIYSGAIHSEQFRWLERDVFAAFFLFVILEQIYCNNSFIKIEKVKILTSLGKYTYSLYMLHFSAIYIVARLFKSFVHPNLFHTVISETIASFLFSLVLAYLSYNYYERYFLRMKEKYSMIKLNSKRVIADTL